MVSETVSVVGVAEQAMDVSISIEARRLMMVRATCDRCKSVWTEYDDDIGYGTKAHERVLVRARAHLCKPRDIMRISDA